MPRRRYPRSLPKLMLKVLPGLGYHPDRQQRGRYQEARLLGAQMSRGHDYLVKILENPRINPKLFAIGVIAALPLLILATRSCDPMESIPVTATLDKRLGSNDTYIAIVGSTKAPHPDFVVFVKRHQYFVGLHGGQERKEPGLVEIVQYCRTMGLTPGRVFFADGENRPQFVNLEPFWPDRVDIDRMLMTVDWYDQPSLKMPFHLI